LEISLFFIESVSSPMKSNQFSPLTH